MSNKNKSRMLEHILFELINSNLNFNIYGNKREQHLIIDIEKYGWDDLNISIKIKKNKDRFRYYISLENNEPYKQISKEDLITSIYDIIEQLNKLKGTLS